MWRFNIPPGWALLRLPPAAFHEFAAALRHASACKNWLVRRHGRCAGLQFCADCAWADGTSREWDWLRSEAALTGDVECGPRRGGGHSGHDHSNARQHSRAGCILG